MVRNAKHITAIDNDGNKYVDGSVASWNMPMDVAGVRFSTSRASIRATAEKPYSPNARFVTDSNWERPGEKVYVFGNPEGLEWSLTDGLLSAYRDNGAIFQISAPAGHGNSGSPVFNEYGLVIGMVKGGIDTTTAGITFAISTDAILEALNMTNGDHPKGFRLGITNGIDLRSKEDIALDNASQGNVASQTAEPAPQTTTVNNSAEEVGSVTDVQEAFEVIIADVNLFMFRDQTAFAEWAAAMRKLGPGGINTSYWMDEIINKFSDQPEYQEYRNRMIADINTLLKLQGHALLPVSNVAKESDAEIRAENEKALERTNATKKTSMDAALDEVTAHMPPPRWTK
jgi:hypothetical protein